MVVVKKIVGPTVGLKYVLKRKLLTKSESKNRIFINLQLLTTCFHNRKNIQQYPETLTIETVSGGFSKGVEGRTAPAPQSCRPMPDPLHESRPVSSYGFPERILVPFLTTIDNANHISTGYSSMFNCAFPSRPHFAFCLSQSMRVCRYGGFG